MNNNRIIRSLEESDIPKIIQRYTFPWSTHEKTEDLWKTYFQEQQEKVRTVGVIDQNYEILGYGSLLKKPESPYFAGSNTPEINAVWIDGPFRGQKLGTALITWLEDLARLEGYEQIGLELVSTKTTALLKDSTFT